jgi:hypothetical protein
MFESARVEVHCDYSRRNYCGLIKIATSDFP